MSAHEAHEQRMIESEERRLRNQATSVARSLRDIADAVEQAMQTRDASMTTTQWSWRAHNIAHRITWGVANLNVDQLALTAAELDAMILTYPVAAVEYPQP